ncbi:MAG TPA: hypothetical protein VM198_00245 [Longimicrobiales bacterium]|nr:hypothetical protein [Longimicrobiales bacterium]
MTQRALLRFVAVYTPAMLDDPKLAREEMVQRGALETIRDEPIPVLVDHDPDRRVGTVRELYIAPDVVAGLVQEWYFASVELDAPPGWLKRNGGVSWACRSLQAQDVRGSTRLLRGLIDEVSVLSPSVRRAEGRAAVAWVGEREVSSAAGPSADRSAAGEEVIYHEPVLVRRYYSTPIVVHDGALRREPVERLAGHLPRTGCVSGGGAGRAAQRGPWLRPLQRTAGSSDRRRKSAED